MAIAVTQTRSAADAEEILCNKLWHFRLGLEGQAGESVVEINVPIALLLSDFCKFAGLSEEQHARVLGEQGVAYVNEVLATRWMLKTSGHWGAARQ